MRKLSVAQTNLDYLTTVKNEKGLDSITKALHVVIQEHKNSCIITCDSLK